jgi:hypothetical protein
VNRSLLSVAGGLVAVVVMAAACAGATGTAPPSATETQTAAAATPAPTPLPATPVPSPTMAAAAMAITIEDDACRYAGPTTIPYGPFEVTWEIRDTTKLEYGLFVFTLAPGRTIEDARTAIETANEGDPPDWLKFLTIYPYGSPGTTEIFRRDLRQMAAYEDGPIYILCAHPDKILGLFGPIEVEQ